MDKIKYTAVYLRSGRTALVGGTEVTLDGDELIVYPDDDGDEVTFNWEHVEFYRTFETELPEKASLADSGVMSVDEYKAAVGKDRGGYL